MAAEANDSNMTGYDLGQLKTYCGYAELGIGLAAFIPNVLVIVVGSRLMRTSQSQILVVSMAIADLCFAVIHCPIMFGQLAFMKFRDEFSCLLVYIVTYVCTISSSLSCLLLNLNKFLAIFAPFKHRVWITRRVIVIHTLAAWFISIVFAITFIFGPAIERHENCIFTPKAIGLYIAFFVCYFVLPIVISLVCSIYIVILTAMRYERGSRLGQLELGQARRKRTLPKARSFRAKNVLYIFSTTMWSAGTALPYRLAYLLITAKAIQPTIPAFSIIFLLFTLMSSNVLGNPIITFLTQRSYLKTLKRLLSQASPSEYNHACNGVRGASQSQYRPSMCSTSMVIINSRANSLVPPRNDDDEEIELLARHQLDNERRHDRRVSPFEIML